jgi:molecular chaperone GrpE
MFSIQEEIHKIAPLDLNDAPEAEPDGDLLGAWEQIATSLSRLGKQQFRANQNAEYLARQMETSFEEVRKLAAEAHEQGERYRRENSWLRDETTRVAGRVVEFMDALDDVTVLARQTNDPRWLNHLERLTTKALQILGSVGITEIPAEGLGFDEEVHEALDTVEREPGQDVYRIVEVIRRGFRFNGGILRRAQVLTTR